ncbi:Spc98 family-domain-containing protein [Parachaetomium inaequale]|uniref:Spindle pole body component n=1 Tax=Parachaetomium inaequale TaxID=2588326 RepID=A0AAN6PC54_9PEZI|nr:Spc98 family-domain-containing protein [Parachaetomium inaequale]
MADEEDPSDLFAIPDFWRPSHWPDHAVDDINTHTHNPLFTFNVPSAACSGASQRLINTGKVQVFNSVENEGDVFFKLPSLLKELADQELKLHPRPSQPSEPSVAHPELEPDPLTSSDDEDFWLSHDGDSAKPPLFRTWESFDQSEQELEQGAPLFLSEAGPAAFDALLTSKHGVGDLPDVLDAALYCACLLNLALGRGSVLFSWNPEKNSFVKTAPYLRISGLSLDSVAAVDSLCLDCGNSARHLQAFAEKTYSAASTPTRVALAGVVDRLVTVVRSELNNSRGVRSILQLQSVVQPAQSVLSYFKGLVKKLAQQRSDEGLLSCLFHEAQASEYRDGLLKEATREVLRILSKPWTDFVEEWIGLRAEGGIPLTKAGPSKGFVKIADKMWIDDQGFELEEPDYFLDEDRVPTFVPEDMAQTIFETGRNLRFLREHHPEHPLSRPDVVTLAMPPKLEWEFDWEAVSKLEARVSQYRDSVSRAIQGVLPETPRATASSSSNKRKYDAAELEYFGKDEAQVQANIVASIRQLDQPMENPEPQDELTRLLHDRLYQTPAGSLDSSSLSPHWTLVPLLSFGPIIEAQSTLVNQECMKLLFSAHHLRVHIDLLRQSFLLGNGLLVSRLTHALFDPNLSTAERRAGVALGSSGTMGLRLAGRKTWPPASSELRLALMGVLSECYASSPLPSSSSSSHNLPGDLSFSVRDLSPPEIDRCMDPHALEALDFLRLSYKPPAALRPVLSPAVLLKYDRVFKLLLRVLRMLYVVDHLSSSPVHHDTYPEGEGGGEGNAARRLGIEARHFVHQVAAYFFDVGITEPWARFEGWLDGVQAEAIGGADNPGSLGSGGSGSGSGMGGGAGEKKKNKKACAASPDVLRERMERVLDEIMGVLFLRRRQAPVMGLLEETFGVVLRFVRARAVGEVGQGETAVELYRLFRKKVGVFITVCRGLGEKMAVSGGGGRGGSEGACVEQLLVRLDMAGFYGRGFGG